MPASLTVKELRRLVLEIPCEEGSDWIAYDNARAAASKDVEDLTAEDVIAMQVLVNSQQGDLYQRATELVRSRAARDEQFVAEVRHAQAYAQGLKDVPEIEGVDPLLWAAGKKASAALFRHNRHGKRLLSNEEVQQLGVLVSAARADWNLVSKRLQRKEFSVESLHLNEFVPFMADHRSWKGC